MSARKLQSGSFLHNRLSMAARQVKLSLSPESVLIRKHGLEFHSPTSFTPWVEMTVTLESPQGGRPVKCSGVVVACSGSKHAGYQVSLVFTSMTKQAESRLHSLALLPLA